MAKFDFGSLNKTSVHTVREGIKSDDMKFAPLKDFVGKTLSVDGFFFTDGKYGKQVVVIADGFKINIPKRYVEEFEQIRDNKEALDSMMAGDLILTDIEEFDSKNGKTVAFNFGTK